MPNFDNDADLIRSLERKIADLNAKKKTYETALAALKGKTTKPYSPHKQTKPAKRKLSAAARKAMSEGAKKAAAARKKAAQG